MLIQNNSRVITLIIFVYTLLCALILRAVYVQIIRYDFFKEKSETQLTKTIKIFPHRGNIYDRNKQLLAMTKPSYSAFTFSSQIENINSYSEKLSPLLGMPAHSIKEKLQGPIPFVWIKRKIDMLSYLELKKQNIEALEFLKEEQRVYPQGNLACHILGFVGIDNQGLGGMEYMYDSFLKGSPGKIVLEGDPRGYRVTSGYKKTLRTPYDGGDIVTTLDSYLQFITQKHLKEAVQENGAFSGQAIIMDPKTGDILAMANFPEFDPNEWNTAPAAIRKNSCVADVYEPGSVFKIVTVSGVLEEGAVEPTTRLYVPETLEIGDRVIHEAHGREPGESNSKSVSEIIEKSLNVGTTLLAKKIGEEKLFFYIKQFGFGKKTGIELPGESGGITRPVKTWAEADLGMISFGQGIAVTPIQMISAVSAVANHGEYMKPRIIQYISYHDKLSLKGMPKTNKGRIISEKTARKVTGILVQTVEKGTGMSARIDGYTIAGKTGTAQKPKPNGLGYMPGHYVASFVGYFPAYNPRIVIIVIVDGPKKSIYGSTIAAPAFRKIALDSILYLNIPPDKPKSEEIK